MNELIDGLWDKHKTISRSDSGAFPEDYGELMFYEEFEKAIQTACKAQRNACAREFRHNRRYIGLSVAEKSIKNAEIERQDYE